MLGATVLAGGVFTAVVLRRESARRSTPAKRRPEALTAALGSVKTGRQRLPCFYRQF